MEGFEVVHEYRETFVRFKIFPRELPKWMIRVGFWGWLLVSAGVVGEFVFENRVSFWTSEIENLSNAMLADAQLSAGTAATSAKEAKDSVKEAKIEVLALKGETTDLESRLGAARSELSAIQQDITNIRASRHLIDVGTLKTELGNLKLKGVKYELEVFSNPESVNLAREVNGVLTAAGMVWNRPRLREPSYWIIDPTRGLRLEANICADSGIQIHVNSQDVIQNQQENQEEAAGAIRRRFSPNLMNIGSHILEVVGPHVSPPNVKNVAVGVAEDNTPTPGIMVICVGEKPINVP